MGRARGFPKNVRMFDWRMADDQRITQASYFGAFKDVSNREGEVRLALSADEGWSGLGEKQRVF